MTHKCKSKCVSCAKRAAQIIRNATFKLPDGIRADINGIRPVLIKSGNNPRYTDDTFCSFLLSVIKKHYTKTISVYNNRFICIEAAICLYVQQNDQVVDMNDYISYMQYSPKLASRLKPYIARHASKFKLRILPSSGLVVQRDTLYNIQTKKQLEKHIQNADVLGMNTEDLYQEYRNAYIDLKDLEKNKKVFISHGRVWSVSVSGFEINKLKSIWKKLA